MALMTTLLISAAPDARATSDEAVIVCEKVNTFRPPVHAIRDVSLSVERGITCIVGPNGAGKTTLLKSIMGLLKVASGRIRFMGKEIANLPAHRIARMGMGYVPEDRRIYPDFTVTENILFGTYGKKVDETAVLERVYSLFPRLKGLARSRGGSLSGGEQTMLAIARTMALDPQCLLLDEPLEGLAPIVRRRVAENILELKSQGLTTMTTASDMSYVPDIADVFHTLERGQIVRRAQR